jgi:hypothetical protein
MSLFDALPVGLPITVHDWAAFRELHRHDLSGLYPEILAALYGFSSLPEYRDDDCLLSIEQMLDASGDPVRARYELACNLGEFFADEYFDQWQTVYTPEEQRRREALMNGAHGPIPRGRLIQPGEPGYVSEIPLELHTKVVGWLVEGIKRFREDEDLFQHIRTIAARRRAGDTFLNEEDIEQLRRASIDELTFCTDKRGQASAREIMKKFDETFGRNPDGTLK